MSLWDGYPVFLCGQERDISDRGTEPTGEELESTLCPHGERAGAVKGHRQISSP